MDIYQSNNSIAISNNNQSSVSNNTAISSNNQSSVSNNQTIVNNNTSLENKTQYKYKINKHQYEFNTPNDTNGLAEQIVDILVCSILSSYNRN